MATIVTDQIAAATAVLIVLAPLGFYLAGCWKAYEKAGREGFEALYPGWSSYVACKVGGISGWWVFLLGVPIVNIFVHVYISIAVARRFGWSAAFGICLAIFGAILWPVLGFGHSEHHGSRGLTFQS